MTEAIKVTYQDVQVTYIEGSNLWEFELRGRTRTAPSLAKAKEFIDKEPAEKRKPFERFLSIKWAYGERKTITVTSYADKGWGGDHNFWTVDSSKTTWRGNPKRSKESASKLIVISPENTEKIQQYDELDKQIKALKEKQERVFQSLERVKPTDEMLKD